MKKSNYSQQAVSQHRLSPTQDTADPLCANTEKNMGVSRNINIQVYTEFDNPYELLKKFLIGFWLEEENSTIRMFYNDDTDNDVLPYEIEFKATESLITERFHNQKVNTISFPVSKLNEGIILSIEEIENEYGTDRLYEIWISPGGAYTLKEFKRNTDFSYYLNKILPRLQSIGCQIWDIKCHDIG